MIDIKIWIPQFVSKLEQTFGNRIWFIGLQGSYDRGEATETSDIDVVVILDELRMNDLKIYREMLDTLPNRDLICGFISGKSELFDWEKSDLFQFCYDTTPIKGSLDGLVEKIDKQDVKRAIMRGACDIFHACVHNFVHEKSDDILRSLYKSAVFTIQAVWFYETGTFVKSRSELQSAIYPPSAVLDTAQRLKRGEAVQFEAMSELLINWTKAILEGYSE